MSSLLALQSNRRQLLVGGACAAAVLAAGSVTAGSDDAALAGHASLVLHDERFPLPADVQQRLQANGARIVQMAEDPVRLWRDQLGALLAPRGTRMLGVTRWPEFMLIRGLAAESRRHVRYQRVDAATGAIVWLIA